MARKNLEAIAQKLGMKTREIKRVSSSPAGTVIVTFDGVAMIDVPEDHPDGAGQHGLMLLAVPKSGSEYRLPVFTGVDDDLEDLEDELDIDDDDRQNAQRAGAHDADINRDDDRNLPHKPSKDEIASTQAELDALHGDDPDVQAEKERVAGEPTTQSPPAPKAPAKGRGAAKGRRS